MLQTVGTAYNDTLRYDVRGKVTKALVPSAMRETNFFYSGMGRLVASRWDNTINADFGVEEYRYNGHGRQIWSKRRDATLDQPIREHFYDALGHLESIHYNVYPNYPSGTNSFRDFNGGGDQTFGTEMHFTQSIGNTGMDASRFYYAADGKLRAVKEYSRTYDQSGIFQSEADVLQEMRYDALGRRITTHTRFEPQCGGLHCVATIERSIWNGDQLLVELRAPGGSLYDTQHTSGKQTGRVSYVHGPGIDAPLSVYRASFPSASTTRIIPFADWRGQYTRGTFYGGASDCAVGGSPCISVDWPAPKLQSYLAGVERPLGDWVGSLVHSHRDQSGLLYRRNRYYDPASGQFTQADPIGLAGGFNLHGYAAGDPVSYSDPFGLCPEEMGGDGATDTLMDCPPGTAGYQRVSGGVEEAIGPGEVLGAVAGGAMLVRSLTRKAVSSIGKAAARKGAPRPSPKFQTPTNAPQPAMRDVPEGWRVRVQNPTEQYPDGYWVLEKPLPGGHWQPINPSTMRPGSRPETHVPLPPSGQ
jgi:RHS repeat-associated protein